MVTVRERRELRGSERVTCSDTKGLETPERERGRREGRERERERRGFGRSRGSGRERKTFTNRGE